MNKILFFGASGRLGKNWVKDLIKDNKVFVNISKNKLFIKNKNFFYKKFDFENIKDLITFCKKKNISHIINCIALTNIEICEKDKKRANYLNYLIAKRLTYVSKFLDIPIIYISTDMLFDGKKKTKYFETDKPSPVNYYSKSKLLGEKEVKKYKKGLIIRTNFYGSNNKNNVTFSDKIYYSKNKIFLWKNIYFTPINIKILIKIINFLINKKIYGVYNVSANKKISKFKLGQKIGQIINKNVQIIPNKFDQKIFVRRPLNMSLCNSKLLKKFPSLRKELTFSKQLNELKKQYKIKI
jgi:dTDP-4-dehydrorhamnose reductase